ncbi:MAG: hypothetical protein QM734_03795 [Cyclobacteriaceae bacterium]
MNTLLQKKINLLIHLAKADGHMDESEKHLIQEILLDAGELPEVDWNQSTVFALDGASEIHDRERLLHWALRLIKVDGILHADEIAYCKALTIKLKFKPELIDHFSHAKLPELNEFTRLAAGFSL